MRAVAAGTILIAEDHRVIGAGHVDLLPEANEDEASATIRKLQEELQKQREEVLARQKEATDAELAASDKRFEALERAFEAEKAARMAAEASRGEPPALRRSHSPLAACRCHAFSTRFPCGCPAIAMLAPRGMPAPRRGHGIALLAGAELSPSRRCIAATAAECAACGVPRPRAKRSGWACQVTCDVTCPIKYN